MQLKKYSAKTILGMTILTIVVSLLTLTFGAFFRWDLFPSSIDQIGIIIVAYIPAIIISTIQNNQIISLVFVVAIFAMITKIRNQKTSKKKETKRQELTKKQIFLWTIGVIAINLAFGFIQNNYRFSQRIDRLKNHSQAIYDAHTGDFIKIAHFTDLSEAADLLQNIRSPERYLFEVYVLRKNQNGHYEFVDSFKHADNSLTIDQAELTPADEENVNSTVTSNTTAVVTEKIISKRYGINEEGKLTAFTPIKENGEVIGYVVVLLDKYSPID